MKNKWVAAGLSALASLLLVACGSSGSDDKETEYPEAYVQFYNGAASSASTYMRVVDGASLGFAAYGDATSLSTVESGETTLQFYRLDAARNEVAIDEQKVNLAKGEKALMVFSDNQAQSEISAHRFERKELSSHFRLFVSSVISGNSQYDVYMAKAGEAFADAHKIATLAYGNFEEVDYWDGTTDKPNFSLGSYQFYLSLPGQTEAVYSSAAVSFAYSTEYVLVLRASAGANSGNIELDLVANSSSVTTYPDLDATAQMRVYNSLAAGLALNTQIEGNNASIEELIEAKQLTGFSAVDFGNYQISAQSPQDANLVINNHLVTLNQGESKTLVLYRNSSDKLSSMHFTESNLPQVHDHQVQVVNLSPDYDDINVYFVRAGETLDKAKYQIAAINFAKNKSISLPTDSYEIMAVVSNDDGAQIVLDRQQLDEFVSGANYIVTLENDATSVTGYAIRILK